MHTRCRSIPALLGLLAAWCLWTPANAQSILRVRADAPPNGDGLTWASAYNDLQTAITDAPPIAELWVAAGEYRPTAGADRSARFELRSGLAMYGGFAGDETTRQQRDITSNATILSGEIGNLAVVTDNCYHVVACVNGDSTALLDGCTVTGGYADVANQFGDEGGGIYVAGGSPMIQRCRIETNHAARGGGMASIGNPTFVSCVFRSNAVVSGGFGGGGAYARDGATAFINCIFENNSASPNGFGGAAVTQAEGALEFINCTITGNTAFFGGAMMTKHGGISLQNCIVWGNVPAALMGAIDAAYCDIEGPVPMGQGNFSLDPQFRNIGAGDYRLKQTSPCIDAGSNAALPAGITLDIAGLLRIADGDGDAIPVVDMGAHERPIPGDVDRNGVVNVFDLLALLTAWGDCNAPCPSGDTCPADLTNATGDGTDCTVNVFDLLLLLGHWSV